MRRQVTHSSHDNNAIRKEIEGNYVYILDLVLICLSNIFYARMLRGGVKKQNHHKIKFEWSIYIGISSNTVDSEPQNLDSKKPSNLFRIYKSLSGQFP